MEKTQTYQNHVRWYPLVHFIIVPLLFLNLFWQIAMLWQTPSWDRAEGLLLAVVLGLIIFAARTQALTAQDRLIRLEERMRYQRVLTGELAARACEMPAGRIIALRFAPDDELSGLVERTLNGEFNKSKEIKLAVKNWRGDHLRV
jgi:hypothetical protein